MPSEIRISYPKMEKQQDQVDEWLRTYAGVGSVRYGGREGEVRHWLNGDDWLYYVQYNMSEQATLELAATVYIFKDEKIATEFALRFS
jgi:hypothetical protein